MNNRFIKKSSLAHQSVLDSHPVRLVKSHLAQALLFKAEQKTPETVTPSAAASQPQAGKIEHRHSPEIHLLGTGPDYCDIEVICGCGDSSRIRCWNSLNEQAQGVAA